MRRVAIGFVLGVLVWGALRFAAQPWPQAPHYHANWAVMVDGVRLDLSEDRYMEEVSACTPAGAILPAARVHMHNNEDQVVHVHDHGVAWGHFLANLGFAAGPDYLILGDGRRLFSGEGATLTYVVNGFVVGEVTDRVIRPGDRLLISYGREPAELVAAEQFPLVASDAPEYDERQDPGGCAGGVELGFWERLRRAFWG